MLDYPSVALDAPELQFPGHRRPGPVPGLQVIVMAVPLTVQSGFADRSLAAQTGRDCIDLTRDIFPGPAPADLAHWAQGMSMDRRGFKATMTQRGHGDEVAITVDVAGLVALRFQYPRDDNPGPHPNARRMVAVRERLREARGKAPRSVGGVVALTSVSGELLDRGSPGRAAVWV